MNDVNTTIFTEQPNEAAVGDDMALDAANPAAEKVVTETTDADAQTGAPTDGTEPSQTADEGVFLPVYNGEVYPLAVDNKEEITTLLQLGMKQRDLLPTLDRFSRLAAACGQPSVKQFIHDVCDRLETMRRQEAVEKYGEDGERFYQLEREERERHYLDMQTKSGSDGQERQDRTGRLATEFEELRQMYPQYGDIREVPHTVMTLAMQKGISLLDAQNRFILAEQQRIDENAAAQKRATAHSTGSLGGNVQDVKPSVMDAFLKGLNSRF